MIVMLDEPPPPSHIIPPPTAHRCPYRWCGEWHSCRKAGRKALSGERVGERGERGEGGWGKGGKKGWKRVGRKGWEKGVSNHVKL